MSPWLTLILILLLAAAALVLLVAHFVGRLIVSPPRMTDGKAAWVLKRLSPGDLGLPFRPMTFSIRDHRTQRPLTLAAWWIPHPVPSGKCVILLHGYADAKVGAIAWAPAFHALGYHILALDLRAHGESGGATTSAGYHERHDVAQVLDQLKAERPNDVQHIVLFGASLGATVAAAVAADRTDIAAVILDSPYANFRHAAIAHLDLLGFPGRPLQRLALRLAQLRTAAIYDDIVLPHLVPRIAAPLMVVQPDIDPFLRDGDAEALARAYESRRPHLTEVWHVPDTVHLMALAADPELYVARIHDFLDRAVTPRQVAAPVVEGLS